MTPSVREATFNDYPQIRELQTRYGLQVRSLPDWEHLWIGNPAFRDVSNLPKGWCLEHNGKLVGFFGNIPLRYEFRGQSLMAVTGHAWVVDEGYRSYAILLLDEFLSQHQPDFFLNCSANVEAAKAFTALGAQRVPIGEWDRAAFWVANSRHSAELWLREKIPWCPKQLSYPAGAVLSCLERPAGIKADNKPVTQVEWFDDSFEEFWRVLHNKSECLLADRSREALEWHYHSAKKQGILWIAIIRKHDTLASYGVFVRQDSHKTQLTRMRLVDFQSIYCREDLLAFVSWAFRKCREEKIDVLESIGFSPCVQGTIERIAPHHRRLPSWTYFFKANHPDLAAELRNAKVWNPTLFDGDASI